MIWISSVEYSDQSRAAKTVLKIPQMIQDKDTFFNESSMWKNWETHKDQFINFGVRNYDSIPVISVTVT